MYVGPYAVIGAGRGDRQRQPNRVARRDQRAHSDRRGKPYLINSRRSATIRRTRNTRVSRRELVIGDRNTIREYCTINRGTVQDEGVTRIGNDNWIMAYSHIAHDCVVGSNTIFANNASIAGHVHIGDYVILGGFTAVHQFCQIGAHALTSMFSYVTMDVAGVSDRVGSARRAARYQRRRLETPRLFRGAAAQYARGLPNRVPRRAEARRGARCPRPARAEQPELAPFVASLRARHPRPCPLGRYDRRQASVARRARRGRGVGGYARRRSDRGDPRARACREFFGVAGPRMIAAGCVPWYRAEELSVMGFAEVLPHLPRLLQTAGGPDRTHQGPGADVFVGIDSPDFNLPAARALKAGGIPSVQYVSPQVWAWRQSRVKRIRAAVDLVLCVLPFETDFYAAHGVRAKFIGHPLADAIPLAVDRVKAKVELGLDPAKPLVAVLPGSRRSEVARLALPFTATAAFLQRSRADIEIAVALASEPIGELYRATVAKARARAPGALDHGPRPRRPGRGRRRADGIGHCEPRSTAAEAADGGRASHRAADLLARPQARRREAQALFSAELAGGRRSRAGIRARRSARRRSWSRRARDSRRSAAARRLV